MKTQLLYAALFLSPAVFGQDAKVKTNQAIEVKTDVKAGDKASVNAADAANTAGTVQATQSTVNSTGQAAMDVKAKTTTRVKQKKAEMQNRTEQVVSRTNQQVANTKISSDVHSSAGISAGKNNKLNAATSLNSAASARAGKLNAGTVVTKDVAVKSGRINASTNSAARTATSVKPAPVKVKQTMAARNSTLLKIK